MTISANFLTINSLKVNKINQDDPELTKKLLFNSEGIYDTEPITPSGYKYSTDEVTTAITITTIPDTDLSVNDLDINYYISIYKEIMNKCNISSNSYSNYLKTYTPTLAGTPYTTDKVNMTALYNEAIKWLNPYGSSINITPSGTTTSSIGSITNIVGNTPLVTPPAGTPVNNTGSTTSTNTNTNTNTLPSEISGNTTSSITYSYNVRIGSSSRMPYTLSQTIGVYDSDFVSTEGNTMDYVAITISRRLTTGGWDMDWGSVTVVKANFPTGYGSSINKDFNSSDNFDKVVGYPATIMYMKGARLGVTSNKTRYTYQITYNDEQEYTAWVPGDVLTIPVDKFKDIYIENARIIDVTLHENDSGDQVTREYAFRIPSEPLEKTYYLNQSNNTTQIKEISVKINSYSYKISYNGESETFDWNGVDTLLIPSSKFIIQYENYMTVQIFIHEYSAGSYTNFGFLAINKTEKTPSDISTNKDNHTKITTVYHQMVNSSTTSNTNTSNKYDYRINQSEWVTNKTSADLGNIPVKSSDFSSGSATITVRKAGGDYIGEVYYDLNDFPKGNDFATKQNNIGVGIGLKCSDCVSSTPNEGFGEDTSSTTSNTTNSITAGGYTATFDPELAHTVSKTGTNVTVALVNSTILNPYVKVYLNGNLVYSGNLGYETHTEHLSNGDTLYTNPSNGQ